MKEKQKIFSIIRQFSWQQQIQKIKVLKCYAERGKSIFLTESSSLGQEPTFNNSVSFEQLGPGRNSCIPYFFGYEVFLFQNNLTYLDPSCNMALDL